jgi:hypothetical protein
VLPAAPLVSQTKPKRKKNFDQEQWRPLAQEELLEEAARTEVRNTESLQKMLALEEETKKRAMVVKEAYRGPLVKVISRKVNGLEQVGPPARRAPIGGLLQGHLQHGIFGANPGPARRPCIGDLSALVKG